MSKDFPVPADICPAAKNYMKALLHELTENMIDYNGLDYLALELIAYTYHTYITAKDLVLKENYVVKERNARNAGISKPHPAVKIMYDANSQLTRLVQEFGLTPKSRGNLNNLQGKLAFNPALDKFVPGSKLKIS